MNTSALASPADLKPAVIEFARSASTEISTMDEELLPQLAQRFLPGQVVYVAHTPKATLQDVVRVALKVQGLGFKASPHIVARRIESETALRAALAALVSGGVEQVLLVAGDLDPPLGPFHSTLEIIDSGVLEGAGIQRIGVAGHPEGHPNQDRAVLIAALKDKQAFGERTGIQMHIATQFTFDPEAICSWDRELTEEGIRLPRHIGVAGPTPLKKLLRFAAFCGVGASLGAVTRNLDNMMKLATMATTPDQMFIGLCRGRTTYSGSLIMQPHIFAFGGTVITAEWLRKVAEGAFELGRNDKFVMQA
jgi:methylenetetrahydrofolate reductase (NADPH)